MEEEKITASPAGALSAWGRLLFKVSDGVDWVCTFFFVMATVAFGLTMLGGVFFRYVLNRSLTWSDEVALIFFIWATLLSIASGYLHGKHVNLDLIIRKLPPGWKTGVNELAEGLTLGYLFSLTVSSFQHLPLVAEMITDALRLPITILFSSIPVACLIMDLHWARRNLASGISWIAAVKLLIAVSFVTLVMLPVGQFAQLTGLSRAIVMLVALFGPMLIGVPVAISLGFMATLYVGVVGDVPFNVGAEQIYNGVSIIALMAIPLLILAGKLMHEAGIARHIVDFAQVLVGRVRGGLGASNVVASFLFGDISGFGRLGHGGHRLLDDPPDERARLQGGLLRGTPGHGGDPWMMAPLAITILMYSSVTMASVSRLAAATIMPAFLLAGSFMLVVLFHARRHNYPGRSCPAN